MSTSKYGFTLTDTDGEPVKYCETHNTVAGHANTNHDACGTRSITFAEMWDQGSS